jgi:hypothetical protein
MTWHQSQDHLYSSNVVKGTTRAVVFMLNSEEFGAEDFLVIQIMKLLLSMGGLEVNRRNVMPIKGIKL